MIKIDKNTLTAEQKRAFQRGDAYYVSPLKQYVRTYHATEYLAPAKVYNTTNYNKINETRKDTYRSRSWN